MLKRTSLILLYCLFATACSYKTVELKPNVPVVSVADLQTRLNDFDSWNLQTRIAIRHQSQAWRGLLHWVQRANTFKMVFTSPMGNRVMMIEGLDDGRIVATDAKQHSDNIDAVVKDLLGVEVRQSDLHFWLMGAPAPDKDYQDIEFSQGGRISSFRQNGWQVQYGAYHDEFCSWRPKQIILSQSDTQMWLNIRSHSLSDGTTPLC